MNHRRFIVYQNGFLSKINLNLKPGRCFDASGVFGGSCIALAATEAFLAVVPLKQT